MTPTTTATTPLPQHGVLAAKHRTTMRARTWWRVAYGGAAVLGFLLGMFAGLLGAAVGFVVAPLIVEVIVRVVASSRAHDDVMTAWAATRALVREESADPGTRTSLLRQGYKRKLGDGFRGEIAGRPALLCHYTYVTRETKTSTDSQGRTSTRQEDEDHDFTVVAFDAALPGVPRLSLAPRGMRIGFLDAIESKLTRDRVVELESMELEKAYKLEVADESDDVTVRRLFPPATIVWLVDQREHFPTVELEGGGLTAFVKGHVHEPVDLDRLVDKTTAAIELLEGNLRLGR